MTPLAFNIKNAMEILTDERRRILSSEARKFAEAKIPCRRRFRSVSTIWGMVVVEHEKIIWRDAYYKRLARIERIKASQT